MTQDDPLFPESAKPKASPRKDRTDKPRPRIGVVLGGEGIKAFAALPLIEHLHAVKIVPDLVVGCSGGALLAALWGAGYDIPAMSRLIVQALNWGLYSEVDQEAVQCITRLDEGRFRQSQAIFKPGKLQETYRAIFKKARIENLSPKTVLMSTDLLSGEPRAMEKGPVADLVYASGAVFPLMPPLRMDGSLLADGAFFSPLPVMEAVRRNVDVIIAVWFDDPAAPEPKGFAECAANVHRVFRRALVESQLPMAIDMHSYEIIPIVVRYDKAIQPWEGERLREIIHRGRLELQAKAAQILAAIEQFGS